MLGIVFAVIGVLVAVLPVAAAELPVNVRREVERARDLCGSIGGTTGPIEAAVFEHDVDGDGIKDWIVDPRKLNCQGSRTPMCDEQCSFHLHMGRPDGTFHGWVHITVVDWEVGRTLAGKPALFLTQSDYDCTPRRKRCRKTFIFERGSMIHVQADPRGRR